MAHDDIIPPHVLRRLAAAADADPRTVGRFLRGERIRVGAVAERIARAVAAAGIDRSEAASNGKSDGGERRRK
jgi:hypothetical protein